MPPIAPSGTPYPTLSWFSRLHSGLRFGQSADANDTSLSAGELLNSQSDTRDRRLYTERAREPTPAVYALSAVAKLVSAKSSVFRDVAIFIRRWLTPAMPHSDPAFI